MKHQSFVISIYKTGNIVSFCGLKLLFSVPPWDDLVCVASNPQQVFEEQPEVEPTILLSLIK